MTLLTFLVIFSTLSFLFFGISCFVTAHMRTEFIRYGLKDHHYLIGVLQILGASGLGVGYIFLPFLSVISSIGLAILMLLGFGVRLKVKDSFIQSAPSIIYAFINAYISFAILYNY